MLMNYQALRMMTSAQCHIVFVFFISVTNYKYYHFPSEIFWAPATQHEAQVQV